MDITKTFNNIYNAHLVRNCTSERCKLSCHAHGYTVDVTVSGYDTDNAGMIVDFGLFKGTIKSFLNLFKDSYSVWNCDSEDFKKFVEDTFNRVIIFPFNPTAENLADWMLMCIDSIINKTEFKNGEEGIQIESVTVHETRTGKATSYRGDFVLDGVVDKTNYGVTLLQGFSDKEKELFNSIMREDNEKVFVNPEVTQQVNHRG